MKFGPIPVNQAEGAILAHSLKLASGVRLKKGLPLTPKDIENLVQSGIDQVTVALLSEDEIGEDEAASRLAEQLLHTGLRLDAASTGRVNVFATKNGLLRVDKGAIDRVNQIDPGITIATLEDYAEVNSGRMVATIKIIPYGVKSTALDLALDALDENVVKISTYQALKVGVIATQLPSLKPSVMDKTIRVLEQRLLLSGSTISREIRVPHESAAVKQALDDICDESDLIILFGASAISDIGDVIPSALVEAGGAITRFGMPVDPGNLLLLGELGETPVIGAPGCSRSPAENGFDWILQRVLAGMPVSSADIVGMGVGGLLMEIGSRPRPREKPVETAPKTAAIILAAGQSSRMGPQNKLLAKLKDKALVRYVAEAASIAANKELDVVVVSGHESNLVREELEDLDLRFAHNPKYEEGLSTSLAAGISAIEGDADQAIVLLGDMPGITVSMIDQLLEAAKAASPGSIIMATHNGKRGNPTLWPKAFFPSLRAISGDVGARHLIGQNQEKVVEVELGEAASFDVDTPDVLKIAREQWRPKE
ncbi:MAG: molybdopterin-binding/glycosyltransferase family 2 protein [Rhizobiaceae bacterium]|nr:molybdopterin-binding/glycosyltransferase family 2 protein [Rhizobiaceae bacterium]